MLKDFSRSQLVACAKSGSNLIENGPRLRRCYLQQTTNRKWRLVNWSDWWVEWIRSHTDGKPFFKRDFSLIYFMQQQWRIYRGTGRYHPLSPEHQKILNKRWSIFNRKLKKIWEGHSTCPDPFPGWTPGWSLLSMSVHSEEKNKNTHILT